MRKTEARTAILSLFLNDECKEFSAKDIFNLLKKFDQATVYRNLDSLKSACILGERLVGNTRFFSLSVEISNHHHFKCENCGKLFPIDCVEINKIKLPKGFKVKEHRFEVSGICLNCTKL